jgi:hypothetical protein
MTRIVVVGSSHVAALKLGWEEIGENYPGVEIEFFAAPVGIFKFFQLSPDKRFGALNASEFTDAKLNLVRELNGGAVIDLKPFDHVVRVGLATLLYSVVGLLARTDVEGLRQTGKKTLISRAAFDAFINDGATNRMLPEEWQNWIQPRMWVVGNPRISEACLLTGRLKNLAKDSSGMCSIPDDHIDPRRWALFVARSILTEMRDGGRTC